MIVHVPGVLGGPELRDFRKILDRASWIDGRATAGHQSARVKQNEQLPETSEIARDLGDRVLRALEQSPLFISAALPARVFPPLFNRYSEGMSFGFHVDNAIRQITGTPTRIRTDVSATLFLSGPEEYDGGELIIEDLYGAHSVKLPAGDLVIYPASSLHRVTPVTRGRRVASFFWVQSMVRDPAQRRLLLDLDLAMQQVSRALATPDLGPSEASRSEPPSGAVVTLTNCYHNLLRMFSDV